MKISILTHAFQEFKPWDKHSLNPADNGKIKFEKLSDEPFNIDIDHNEQLTKAGFSKEDIDSANRQLSRYKAGIDFATDGKLFIARTGAFSRFIAIEQQLYKYARDTMPHENLYFVPGFGFDDDLTVEKQAQMISDILFDKTDGDTNCIDLYGMGIAAECCVPLILAIIKAELEVNSASVIGNFCDEGLEVRSNLDRLRKKYLSEEVISWNDLNKLKLESKSIRCVLVEDL